MVNQGLDVSCHVYHNRSPCLDGLRAWHGLCSCLRSYVAVDVLTHIGGEGGHAAGVGNDLGVSCCLARQGGIPRKGGHVAMQPAVPVHQVPSRICIWTDCP